MRSSHSLYYKKKESVPQSGLCTATLFYLLRMRYREMQQQVIWWVVKQLHL